MFDPYLGKWICSPSMLLSVCPQPQCIIAQFDTPSIQITSRFGFSRYILFVMHIDIYV
jgi:hypothetical protein